MLDTEKNAVLVSQQFFFFCIIGGHTTFCSKNNSTLFIPVSLKLWQKLRNVYSSSPLLWHTVMCFALPQSDAVLKPETLFCVELPTFSMSVGLTFNALCFRHWTSVAISEYKIDPLIQLEMAIFCTVAVWRLFVLFVYVWEDARSKKFWDCYHWTNLHEQHKSADAAVGSWVCLVQAARSLPVLWWHVGYVSVLIPSLKRQPKLQKTVLTKLHLQSFFFSSFFSVYCHISTTNAKAMLSSHFFNVINPSFWKWKENTSLSYWLWI